MKKDSSTLIENRGATFHYDLVEEYVAGLILTGAETKSLRAGHAVLHGAWCKIENGKIILQKFQINKYPQDNTGTHDPMRPKQILLKQDELKQIAHKMDEQKMQLIPMKVFKMGRWVKVKLGLGKARKTQDKRQHIKERELKQRLRKITNHY